MSTKRMAVESTGDIERRIAAVVTAFRAETQIELPVGYLALAAETGDRRDTVDGEFAWWCTRHEAVLSQHGLYVEHPISTVIKVWVEAAARDTEPEPWCRLTIRAPASHLRVYWPEGMEPAEWQTFRDTGYAPGMTHAAWLSEKVKDDAAKPKARPRDAP